MEATDAMTDPIRVLLVDDEELMRAGLRLMIDGAAGIEVIGEAADGAQAVTQVSALDPDVVLMDVRMPGTDGIEATAQLTEHGSRARIVVLTAFDTDHFLLDALRAGAVSFLLKDSPPEDVVRAVHEAAEGQARFSPAVLRRLVRLAAGPTTVTPTQNAPASAGAAGAGAGATGTRPTLLAVPGAPEIADALFLSLPTIKTHVAHLFDKLQVTNRVQLAIRVLEQEEGR
jgi:DNA-binding NarL/FixJ family response regulator